MKKRLSGDCKRFRLLLMLELAVMLPAAALLYINFRQLHTIQREKKVEAMIHRDFLEMLAISEKRINEKAYAKAEEIRRLIPSPDRGSEADRRATLDRILSNHPGWHTCSSSMPNAVFCCARNRGSCRNFGRST